jgi:hypothetical protein
MKRKRDDGGNGSGDDGGEGGEGGSDGGVGGTQVDSTLVEKGAYASPTGKA